MSFFRYSTIFIMMLALAFQLPAQTAKRPAIIKELTSTQTGSNKIQIIGDKHIEELLAKYIDNNARKNTITGYRLRIFSQSTQNVARENAYKAKAKFLDNFSDVNIEVDFIAPDWVVYVGKFRNRIDAFRLKKQIENIFPNAFILEKQIEYKEL